MQALPARVGHHHLSPHRSCRDIWKQGGYNLRILPLQNPLQRSSFVSTFFMFTFCLLQHGHYFTTIMILLFAGFDDVLCRVITLVGF